MNEDRNQQQRERTERNPTLDAPGSEVADYGNPTGGSAVEGQNPAERQPAPGRENPDTQRNETLGTP